MNHKRVEDAEKASPAPPASSSSDEPALPFWRIMLSVFQAAFGVQNQSNRERDFSQGSIIPFVVAALVFTIVFIAALVLIVSAVLG